MIKIIPQLFFNKDGFSIKSPMSADISLYKETKSK